MVDQNNTQEDEALTDFSNSPNFVGSILVAVDGDVYSLKQKEDGTFGGYKINYGTDGSIVSAYELNEQDLTYLKEKGALVVYEKNNNKRQDEEDVDIFEETKTLIMKLFKEGDKFDLSKRLPDDIKDELKKKKKKISQIE